MEGWKAEVERGGEGAEVGGSTVVGGFLGLGLGLEGGRRSLSSLKRVKRLGLRKRWG